MGLSLQEYQTTLKSRVTLSGIGVHSGKAVSILPVRIGDTLANVIPEARR